MSYNLVTPCAQCPFRSDIRPFIAAERVREILTGQGNFHCHKTVDYEAADAGRVTDDSKVCAGFLICLEHEGKPNQMMRIAERLGMYDPSKLRMDAPVYQSIGDAVAAHKRKRVRA